ncbi:MAG: hypothetical protein M3155_04825 [Actinomycetota bacterium]|nr:hypothetical protein [Actinomycetota bacterium]
MRKLLITLAGVALLAGCGSSGTSSHKSAATTPQISIPRARSGGLTYHPKIDPAKFTNQVTNPYWPMRPGRTWVYDGVKDGAPEHVVVTVKPETKTIMGVRCVVITDTVTANGSLAEKTTDWYAQDSAGNVWYFGEDSKDYKNGVVVSTQGTWEAGVDGAQPGIVAQAKPRRGPTYRQEYRPGVAEDMAKVIQVGAVERVPAGTFRDTIVTLDTDPLNPAKIEHKSYAPGVGPVHVKRQGSAHTEEIKLVKVIGR